MLASRRLAALALLLVACAGKSEGSSPQGNTPATNGNSLTPCDPLAANTTAVKLDPAQVMAAGRAKDGTVYVIYASDRLFVGSDASLEERTVIGSGQGPNQTDLDYIDDDGTPVTVEFTQDSAGKRLTVARGAQTSKGIDAGNGEALTLLDTKLLPSLKASATQSFRIDFAASLPDGDGRELVVIAPAHGADYAQFRVFLGPPTKLSELRITNFFSSRSGQRSADVTIDGDSADLTYLAGGPSDLNPNGGPTTLTIGETIYELTEGDVPSGASYFCFPK